MIGGAVIPHREGGFSTIGKKNRPTIRSDETLPLKLDGRPVRKFGPV
jgi:hypothetical protein